jgi:hypothetical protein
MDDEETTEERRVEDPSTTAQAAQDEQQRVSTGQRWNDVLWLLRSNPEEFLPDGTKVGMTVTNRRGYFRQQAEFWVNSPALTEEERERIRSVWIDGKYVRALDASSERTEQLASLLAR